MEVSADQSAPLFFTLFDQGWATKRFLKFFFGSDYPHAEGFTEPVANARRALARLPESSVNKVLGDNAARFFGI